MWQHIQIICIFKCICIAWAPPRHRRAPPNINPTQIEPAARQTTNNIQTPWKRNNTHPNEKSRQNIDRIMTKCVCLCLAVFQLVCVCLAAASICGGFTCRGTPINKSFRLINLCFTDRTFLNTLLLNTHIVCIVLFVFIATSETKQKTANDDE